MSTFLEGYGSIASLEPKSISWHSGSVLSATWPSFHYHGCQKALSPVDPRPIRPLALVSAELVATIIVSDGFEVLNPRLVKVAARAHVGA